MGFLEVKLSINVYRQACGGLSSSAPPAGFVNCTGLSFSRGADILIDSAHRVAMFVIWALATSLMTKLSGDLASPTY